MQFSEHGQFLGLMRLHAAQNVVQSADGADDVRSLVEHDAFGPVSQWQRR